MSALDEVLDGSIADTARLVAGGEVSASELTAACIARIEAANMGRGSFVRVRHEAALAAARAVDALEPEARAALPLCGVPVAHKDLFSLPGETATFCSHERFHRRGTSLASALSALQAAGAIDVGALHMSEFAMGPSGWSSVDGAIDNPLDAALVSGGSSSGSAAAVGGGFVPGSLGTDTGGSIRLPAPFCGVAALKPSGGRVSTRGALPVSQTLDTVGPIARSVADCALLFAALAAAPVAASSARPLRFARLSPESLPVAPDDDVNAAIGDVVGRLTEAGVDFRETGWADFAQTNMLSGAVFLAEAATVHLHGLTHHAELIGPQVRERLLQGLASPAPIYLSAMAAREETRNRFEETVLAGADVLLLPLSPSRAPTRESYRGLTNTGDILRKNGHVAAYTGCFNYLDLPVLSMPATPHAARNSIGLQVVGRKGCEEVVLEAGRLIERLLD